MKWRSLWQTPLATVRTSTSRGPGLSISTSSIVSGSCGPWKMAAFMLALLVRATYGPEYRTGGRHDAKGLADHAE